MKTSQSNHSRSHHSAFLLSLLCENDLKLNLRIPAVKCHRLISKLLFQMQRSYYLLVTHGEVHDCCLTVYQEAFKPQCWFCSQPAAPLFILTHWQCWEFSSSYMPNVCTKHFGLKPSLISKSSLYFSMVTTMAVNTYFYVSCHTFSWLLNST